MGPMSRREFAKATAAATAAAGLPAVLTPAAQAKKKRRSPSDKLRVAIVGARGRGKSHVGGFAGRHGCVVTTVCDCDSGVIGSVMRTAEKRQKGKAPKYVKDVRKVVEDPEIDIISIATPNHWHALMAIWALQNGKDVYVEKPVSHNVWEGRKIVEAAAKYKRVCQAGTQCRSHKGIQDAMKFLHTGGLGKVTLARGLCYKPRGSIGNVKGDGSVPKSMDYNLWCGPGPKRPPRRSRVHYDWHWIYDYGNGDLGNQGIHQMDLARWGLNKPGLANAVMSLGGRFAYEDDGETANTQVATFDYGDAQLIFEVRGLGTADWLADYRDKKTTDRKQSVKIGDVFYGENGQLIINSYTGAVACDKDWNVTKVFKGGGDHFGNFVDAVRAGSPDSLNGPIVEGHLSSALCHLANISLRLGEAQPLSAPADSLAGDKETVATVKRVQEHVKENRVDLSKTQCQVGPKLRLDPQQERFVGNNGKANDMLKDDYRKGFEVPEAV